MSANTKQISALNKLITALYDGENGYKEAAEEVDNTALAARFKTLAQQRYDFGHEIKPFITQLGGEVDKGGSTAASLHRVWMDLKSAVSSNDEKAILKECVRGEESAIEAYQEVIADGELSVSARAVVTNQLNQITSSLAEMRRLSENFATA
ncbi:MAG: PA2169 family four-helix-bundle protein [Bacteroidota bacterium]